MCWCSCFICWCCFSYCCCCYYCCWCCCLCLLMMKMMRLLSGKGNFCGCAAICKKADELSRAANEQESSSGSWPSLAIQVKWCPRSFINLPPLPPLLYARCPRKGQKSCWLRSREFSPHFPVHGSNTEDPINQPHASRVPLYTLQM